MVRCGGYIFHQLHIASIISCLSVIINRMAVASLVIYSLVQTAAWWVLLLLLVQSNGRECYGRGKMFCDLFLHSSVFFLAHQVDGSDSSLMSFPHMLHAHNQPLIMMSRTTTGSAPDRDSPYQQAEDPHTRGARLGTGPSWWSRTESISTHPYRQRQHRPIARRKAHSYWDGTRQRRIFRATRGCLVG